MPDFQISSNHLITDTQKPMSCKAMLQTMLKEQDVDILQTKAQTMRFSGVDGMDVYNLTAPFQIDGMTVIGARIEPRETMVSDIQFFTQPDPTDPGGCWTPVPASPVFRQMQDPCVARIGQELVFGAVRYPIDEGHGADSWQMRFFRGDSLFGLKPFLDGPANMKDIRLVELKDGRIGIFTRPHFGMGPDGQPIKIGVIGFTIADSLDDITAEMIQSAPLLRNQMPENEKTGANEIHLLEDGRLGVLAHAAYDAPEGQHYFATSFILNPVTFEFTPMKMIACRDLFPKGPAKRTTLEDVVFSGGLIRHGDGRATVYCGLSDCECGHLDIVDPFA